MLENIDSTTDEVKRQLYVAMTRAKQNLTIHLNSGFLNSISAENLERIEDSGVHLPPSELAMHLTHKDIWLDYFTGRQSAISRLTSGDTLIVNGEGCSNQDGQPVVRFSRKFAIQIESMKEKGYELKTARVGFIVYWLKEEASEEVQIVLPELYFTKTTNI